MSNTGETLAWRATDQQIDLPNPYAMVPLQPLQQVRNEVILENHVFHVVDVIGRLGQQRVNVLPVLKIGSEGIVI
jgi:hypothetical protein